LEAALMTDIAAARSEEFDEILRQREPQVLRTAYRVLGNWADAEDVAQEAFVKLHRHGLGFASDAAIGAWLYRVTVNLCLDRRRRLRPAAELTGLAAPGESPEAVALGDERKRKLMAALARLPVKERAAIVLREIEGLSTAEVAAALGSSEGTVRSQISHALSRLRGWMA
jgi:RNA polymerase sigma-70 factor (ECF subfamily)